MNKTQSAAQGSFRRVREFLSAHPPEGAPPSFAKKVAELDDVMSSMSQQANEQNTGTRLGAGEAKRQSALRATLWDDHMVRIAELARSIFGVPGVKEALKLPKKSVDNVRLLSSAEGMANAADAEKAAFLDNGMPDDFVDQLRAAAKALQDALVVRDQAGRRRTKATKSVQLQVQRGARAVLALNALLRPALKKNPDLKAAWKSAKSRKAPGRGGPAGVTLAPTQPTQAQPTVSTPQASEVPKAA